MSLTFCIDKCLNQKLRQILLKKEVLCIIQEVRLLILIEIIVATVEVVVVALDSPEEDKAHLIRQDWSKMLKQDLQHQPI